MTRVLLNIFANRLYATTESARSGANAVFVPTLNGTDLCLSNTYDIVTQQHCCG